MIRRKYWPKAWRGCFYWADVSKVAGFNKDMRGRRTEAFLLLPLGDYGIALMRTKPEISEDNA